MGLISPDVGLPKPDVVLFFDITPDSTRACEGFGDEIFKKKTFQDIVYKEMKNLMLKNQNICKIFKADRSIRKMSRKLFVKN